MKNNNDPIQESEPLRLDIDELIKDDKVKEQDTDDLHNCSNDLSDAGSIKEEIAHGEFAKQKREEMFNEITNNYSGQNEELDIKNRKKISPLAICLVIFIIIAFCVEFFSVFEDEFSELNYFSDDQTEYSNYEETIKTKEKLFADSKKNITINSSILSDGTIILDIFNQNYTTFNDIKVQTIFYDGDDNPVKICENNINTLLKKEDIYVK